MNRLYMLLALSLMVSCGDSGDAEFFESPAAVAPELPPSALYELRSISASLANGQTVAVLYRPGCDALISDDLITVDGRCESVNGTSITYDNYLYEMRIDGDKVRYRIGGGTMTHTAADGASTSSTAPSGEPWVDIIENGFALVNEGSASDGTYMKVHMNFKYKDM